MNSINIISPYLYEGTWVFDDDRVGLVKEALIAGIDTMLDILTQDIPNAGKGFNLFFSHTPFPGYQIQLDWLKEEADPAYGGNWYFCKQFGIKGWLYPALFLYYSAAPEHIYVQAKKK
jgi:hypothetical protein